jgi:hypothetical protein
MILNVDASVLVLRPALAFVGFEWVRARLLDHACVRVADDPAKTSVRDHFTY